MLLGRAVWFKRFINSVLARRSRGAGSEQERRIAELLGLRAEYPGLRSFLNAVLDALPPEEPLQDATVARMARSLRGIHADRLFADEAELAEHAEFWFRVSYNFPDSAYARACYADILAAADDVDGALAHFADAFDAKPELLFEFGNEVYDMAKRAGGDIWLRYQIACLRAALDQDAHDAVADEDDDYVRELYSELLEEYRDDPAAMRRIIHIGAQLRDMEAADRLPRAIVRRGAWRK